MRGQTYVILGVLVTILVAVFAVFNVGAVDVNYLFWTGESPLILVILVSVLMGALISAAVGSYRIIHLQRELKTLRSENEKMTTVLEDHDLFEQTGIETEEIKQLEENMK